jgi:hypothetical protein
MLAWLAATNHCVFSSPVPTKVRIANNDRMPPDCPMHAKHQPSQSQKQNGCGDLPCCKNLQATASISAKLVASPLWTGAFVLFFPSLDDATHRAAATHSPFCDTGPPGERSFAELVLQRSVLSHAPPISLS